MTQTASTNPEGGPTLDRVVFGRVGVLGAFLAPLVLWESGDPAFFALAPVFSGLLAAAGISAWRGWMPLAVAKPLGFATGAAVQVRVVQVAASPELSAFLTLGGLMVLMGGAYYLWSDVVALTVSGALTIAGVATVSMEGDQRLALLTAAYAGATAVVLHAGTMLRHQLAEQRELANSDELTGLHNRRGMLVHLRASMVRQLEGADPEALLLFDIDHFKLLNDLEGHDAGDAALQRVARTAQRVLGEHGEIGRWGGEEFVILCPGSPEFALDTAQLLRERVQEETGVTVSVGLAFAAPGESVRGWVSRADHAMYQAKEAGRNRVVRAHHVPRRGSAELAA